MKYLFCCLMAVSLLMACKTDDTVEPDCSIKGRWIIEGLNESTLYEFTDDLRYTIYSTTPGEFGTIADAIPGPNDYYFEGDSLVIDLNFGNFSITKPIYKCDCNVVELTNASGASILYQEGYVYADCDE